MGTFTIKFVAEQQHRQKITEGNYLFGFATYHRQVNAPAIKMLIESVLHGSEVHEVCNDIGPQEIVIIVKTFGNAIEDRKALKLQSLYLYDGNYLRAGYVNQVKDTFA